MAELGLLSPCRKAKGWIMHGTEVVFAAGDRAALPHPSLPSPSCSHPAPHEYWTNMTVKCIVIERILITAQLLSHGPCESSWAEPSSKGSHSCSIQAGIIPATSWESLISSAQTLPHLDPSLLQAL